MLSWFPVVITTRSEGLPSEIVAATQLEGTAPGVHPPVCFPVTRAIGPARSEPSSIWPPVRLFRTTSFPRTPLWFLRSIDLTALFAMSPDVTLPTAYAVPPATASRSARVAVTLA
jgi:hypothetical protein